MIGLYRCGYDDCELQGVDREITDEGPLPADDERRACPACQRPLDRVGPDRFDHVAADRPTPLAPTAEELADRAEAEKADSVAATNAVQIRTRLEDAIAKLEQAGAGWSDLTPAQKDAATRLAVRAVAKLARLQLRRLDAVE